MRPRLPSFAAVLLTLWFGVTAAAPATLAAQTLRGSSASLDRQNEQARAHGFSYLRTPDQVRQFVAEGYLVPVHPNRDFDVHNVSFPYARPEVRLFVERLASQYRGACGDKLVVTSLTRPISNQPINASSRSVHPTGMAVDFRRSTNPRCRSWLESTLLSLESRGLLEVIHERNPPHYHVAVYPRQYAQHVTNLTGNGQVVTQVAADDPEIRTEWITHRVTRGETLTAIARRYDVSLSRVRAENEISGSRIIAGQNLRIPVPREVSAPATRVAESEGGLDPDPTDQASAVDVGLDEGAARTEPNHEAQPGGEEGDGGRGVPAHRVTRGETLWGIARLYGVPESELRAANGISGSRITVGQELTVPGAALSEASSVVRHRVARGESLWVIARRHGTSVDEIRRQNGIGSTRIYAGQVLEVPVGR